MAITKHEILERLEELMGEKPDDPKLLQIERLLGTIPEAEFNGFMLALELQLEEMGLEASVPKGRA